MQRKYDFVVFGATGFTGAFVVEYLKRYLHQSRKSYTFAVAARNTFKLEQTLEVIKKRNAGNPEFQDITNTPIIICDVNKRSDLSAMCQQTKIVLNCVGPYRFFGEQVVRACIESKTDYLDITGEPYFIENMEYLYDNAAKNANVLILNTCGFDSVPADLGTLFTKRQCPENTVCTVESFLCITGTHSPKGHFTTFECAVHGISQISELQRLRKNLLAKKKSEGFGKPLPYLSKRLPPRKLWEKPPVPGYSYTLPFPGSDASVVRRTQRLFYERNQIPPLHYGAYVTIASTASLVLMLFFGVILKLLATFTYGRKLLLSYPEIFTLGLFSRAGPSTEHLKSQGFEMIFRAKYLASPSNSGISSRSSNINNEIPNKTLITSVSGPEPGYVATPIILVQCAITVLEERQKIADGVLTPAFALQNTKIIDRLNENGITFNIKSRAH